jgi:hypothetical protein
MWAFMPRSQQVRVFDGSVFCIRNNGIRCLLCIVLMHGQKRWQQMGLIDLARSYLGGGDDFRLGIDASVRFNIEASVYLLPGWSQRYPDRLWRYDCD